MNILNQIDWPIIGSLLKTFASVVVVPLAMAFIQSERLALDTSTKANGLVHGWRLFKLLLATVPPADIQSVAAKADSIIPGSSQIVGAITQEKENNDEKSVSDPPTASGT